MRGLSVFDHHDVTEEDVYAFEREFFDGLPFEKPRPRRTYVEPMYLWKCCGAYERRSIWHECKPQETNNA